MQKSKIAASALGIAGVISGIIIAVYLEMLAVGVAVAVCCLAVAAIIYLCNRPSSLLDKKQSSYEAINNQRTLST